MNQDAQQQRTPTHARLREIAEQAARAAGAQALRRFRRLPPPERKPDGSFVTVADREAERAAREVITGAFPDHQIVGEEFGSADARGPLHGPPPPSAPPRWWIDPIDGTHNYLRGNHLFASLVAVEAGPDIVAGAVYNPVLDEMLSAHRGGGCHCNGEPATVSDIARLEDAQLVHGGFTWIEKHQQGTPFLDLTRRCWRTRGFGDYFGHVLVATGRADIMLEPHVKPWDLAAVQIVVEEAGGRFTDLRGERTIYSGSALATNGRLHDAVLAVLTPPDSDEA